MELKQLFLLGMGRPRLPKQKHLSRAWSQPQRVYSPLGLSPAIQEQETQGRYLTNRKERQMNNLEMLNLLKDQIRKDTIAHRKRSEYPLVGSLNQVMIYLLEAENILREIQQ